ncbi:MAG TPA: PAS domain S-box protein [Thermoanaerobaculia bacterium]|nr:PAS domain S-box protein [Thermoanaerobaculia bacterium]
MKKRRRLEEVEAALAAYVRGEVDAIPGPDGKPLLVRDVPPAPLPSETRYRQLFEHAVAGVFRAAADGTLLEVNRALVELLGRGSAEEIVGLRLRDLVIDIEPLRHGQRLLDALGEAVAVEVPISRPDGRCVWALVSAAIAPADGDRAAEIFGTAVDITPRKLADERLRESEERFAHLFDSSPAPTAVSTLEQGIFLAANAAFGRLMGYQPSEVLGRNALELCLWVDPAERALMVRELASSSSFPPREVRLRRKGGETITVVLSGEKIAFGGETCLLAFSFDVEERVRAARELLEQKTLLEQAEEVASMGSWISDIDVEGELVWSREVYRITGVLPADFDGRVASFFALVHPDDRDVVAAASRAAIAGEEEYRIDHRIVRPGGEVRWVHERARIVRGSDGAAERMIGIVQDITDRKRLEEQFLQAQKLEVVGRLAGGVAHDFNNLLTVILGYGESVLEKSPEGTELREAAEQICHAAENAAMLTRSLLTLSRKSLAETGLFDLGSLARGFERLLARTLGEDVAIDLRVSAEPCRIVGDAAQLEQVLLNLAINARDAMPGGGHLSLSIEPVELSRLEAAKRGRVAGRFVAISFADTGAGMPPEVLSHIFEPFFTTKEKGRGTGLGLATVWSVVEAHRGFIDVESVPGRGTRFEILLPAAEPAERPVAARTEGASGRARRGSILLVEDESALRRLAASILRRAGYQVLEAGSGDEAIQVGRQNLDTIDLLVSDVVLPGPRGPEVFLALRELRDDLPVLFITGYAEWQPREGASLELPGPVLPKPFTGSELLARVAERLDREPGDPGPSRKT